ncbi:hypothetical protein GCM10010317_099630 [Streptomyces mirabilis]|nr:hypothetical protein GCM10010317_099630 [Streptomyces mirabilis]
MNSRMDIRLNGLHMSFRKRSSCDGARGSPAASACGHAGRPSGRNGVQRTVPSDALGIEVGLDRLSGYRDSFAVHRVSARW